MSDTSHKPVQFHGSSSAAALLNIGANTSIETLPQSSPEQLDAWANEAGFNRQRGLGIIDDGLDFIGKIFKRSGTVTTEVDSTTTPTEASTEVSTQNKVQPGRALDAGSLSDELSLYTVKTPPKRPSSQQ